MRLGDLDALYDFVEARYRQSSGEEHKAERALLDAICEMPTIPAIPVEWIENKREEWRKNGVPRVMRGVITALLVQWQEEQEAR